jgi:membrane protein
MTSRPRVRFFNRFPVPERIRDSLAHYLGGLFRRFGEHQVFLLAKGIAFSVFLCILPMVLVVFFVLGSFLETSSVENVVDRIIRLLIPYAEYGEFVKKILLGRIQEVILFKTLAGYVGIIGLLFTASGLFSAMRAVLNRVFGAIKTQTAVKGKMRDFGMVLLVLFFFLVSTAVLPLMDVVQNAAGEVRLLKTLHFSGVQNFLVWLTSFAIIFLAFFTLYNFIPNRRLGFRVASVSALTAAVLYEIAKQAFGYYITNFASVGKLYGAYVLVVVVALWIYYSSIIFIVGAEVGQLYRERREQSGKR